MLRCVTVSAIGVGSGRMSLVDAAVRAVLVVVPFVLV
jgi:hypothetical protein